MKVSELVTGLGYMITNEQRAFIHLLKKQDIVNRHDLEERQQRLAEEMTKNGIIDRFYNEETKTVFYKLQKR
jgi:hypothetical protein